MLDFLALKDPMGVPPRPTDTEQPPNERKACFALEFALTGEDLSHHSVESKISTAKSRARTKEENLEPLVGPVGMAVTIE